MHEIKIGIADDHKLFRKGLISILNSYPDLKVIWEAENGEELIEHIKSQRPDVALVDINMPMLNGAEAVKAIRAAQDNVCMLALSMFDDEKNIMNMIENGVNGYMLKDSEPDEIYVAIKTVLEEGIYYSGHVSKILTNAVLKKDKPSTGNPTPVKLNDKESQFLKLICQELTHKEISEIMCVSERTVDGYRDKLLEKLNVKNRVGLVLYAIKNGFAEI